MNKTDTTADARKVLFNLYRQMSVTAKTKRLFEAYHTGCTLAMAGIRLLNPSATETQVWQIWAERHLGHDLFNQAYRTITDG